MMCVDETLGERQDVVDGRKKKILETQYNRSRIHHVCNNSRSLCSIIAQIKCQSPKLGEMPTM